MPGETGVFRWTKPIITDLLEDIPGIVAAGIQDIENSLIVATDSLAHSAPHTSWPLGMSAMAITTTNAETLGWPLPNGGAVFSLRRGASGDVVFQLVMGGYVSTHPTLYMRVGSASGWSPLTLVAGSGQPWGTASGQVVWSNTASASTKTIAFPADTFSSAPNVVASTHDRRAICAVQAISATGFTLALGNNTGGDTMPVQQDWQVDWIAMQSY